MNTFFDQRNQTVTIQYNIINNDLDSAQSKDDVLRQLSQLPTLVTQAAENGEIDKLKALDVKNSVEKAVVTAEMPEAAKTGIIEYINSAKELLEGVASAGGLVTAFTKAVEAVRKFF